MLFGRSVGVEWSQSGRVHGLLRATLMRPATGLQGITLKVGDQSHPVDLSALPADATQVPVNIHTHLLGNGPVKLELQVQADDGKASTGSHGFQVANEGALAERVRETLRRGRVPLAFAGPCDAGRYDYADSSLQPWFDRPDAEAHITNLQETGRVDAEEAELLRGFVRDGFLAVPEALPEDLVARAQADIAKAVDEGYQGYQWGESTRLEQMHATFPAIREIWLLPRIHRLLGLLFDEQSQPCQSLVYVFGSQQDAHQDTIHLTPYPAGYMCGVWVALEDVQPGSGELVVYPGSHRLPRVYMKDTSCPKVQGDWSRFGETVVKRWGELVEAAGFTPQPYVPKSGSVLIWHENLMHAGSVRRDKSLSRRSIVTHNFARGSLVYYDSTGLAGYTYDRTQIA
ncbi:phytanoyl-CoA dioxygenase family protein [Arenimonas sp.]|uniref:phytanoyl-CoA dioxygenase family protein n=1 Tax=Arenimonas sp. TaxID=1872635 RepID=UPI0035B4E14B